jgi:hypothetical protein
VGFKQIAEQLDVERIVLDDQNSGQLKSLHPLRLS